MNKALLTGRLGKDPEIKNHAGATVVNFTLATTESYKDKTTGQKKEIVEWHNVVAWRGLAEVAGKYLKKGDKATIIGKIRTKSWEKDGVTRYSTQIVADEIEMLGGTRPAEQQLPESPQTENPSTDGGTDDLPF
jgi:single-strand DNA-binding protein